MLSNRRELTEDEFREIKKCVSEPGQDGVGIYGVPLSQRPTGLNIIIAIAGINVDSRKQEILRKIEDLIECGAKSISVFVRNKGYIPYSVSVKGFAKTGQIFFIDEDGEISKEFEIMTIATEVPYTGEIRCIESFAEISKINELASKRPELIGGVVECIRVPSNVDPGWRSEYEMSVK